MIDCSAGYLHGGHDAVDHLSFNKLSQMHSFGCYVAQILGKLGAAINFVAKETKLRNFIAVQQDVLMDV